MPEHVLIHSCCDGCSEVQYEILFESHCSVPNCPEPCQLWLHLRGSQNTAILPFPLSHSHQHHDPGLGLPLVHQLHDGLDAASHLLCCVSVVVGTHPDHYNLWKERHGTVVRAQAKGALAAHGSPAHLRPDVFQFPIL